MDQRRALTDAHDLPRSQWQQLDLPTEELGMQKAKVFRPW